MERKKMVKKGVLQMAARVAEFESNTILYGWPPPCMGFLYQPKRPKKTNKNEQI